MAKPDHDLPNDDLIERLRRGDATAIAEFLALRHTDLIAFIERRLGAALRRKIEPDDIFQEVSAEAVRGINEAGLGDRDPFAWMCQLSERRIIDAHRHFFGAQKRNAAREVPLSSGSDADRPGFINELVASMTTPSEAFSRKGRELQLQQALATLPEEQREALRLRYVEGLATKDIAERTGRTDGAVRVMLSRSLAKLQRMLAAKHDRR
jgi:RNA polymerase sigma-70 factor (ECF subfamily)